jgi:hypothetical protein
MGISVSGASNPPHRLLLMIAKSFETILPVVVFDMSIVLHYTCTYLDLNLM